MTGVALLDVNVLVALFDPDHPHHDPAHDWFSEQRASGWATCPLSENGLVRVLSNPAYGSTAERPGAVRERLRTFCGSGHHTFWADDVSLRDGKIFRPATPITWRQVTDIYLLALARRHGGRLATFDRSIRHGAVTGATAEDLSIITA